RRSTFKDAIEAMLENLSHDEHADSALQSPAIPRQGQLRKIVCVAGRNELDEAAAMLLTNMLHLEGHTEIGRPLSAGALSGDAGYLALFTDASIVCLSLVSTSSPARARYLVRRIRRRAPLARIVVGFWGPPTASPMPSVEETTRAISAQHLALSLTDAVAAIDTMLTGAEESALAA